MCGAKTALRESFCTAHVGFSHDNADEDVKIETDRGKIGVGKNVTYFYIPHGGELPPMFYHPCYV